MSMFNYFSVHELKDLTEIFDGYKIVINGDGGRTLYITDFALVDVNFKREKTSFAAIGTTTNYGHYNAVTTKELACSIKDMLNEDEESEWCEVVAIDRNRPYNITFTGADNVEKIIYFKAF